MKLDKTKEIIASTRAEEKYDRNMDPVDALIGIGVALFLILSIYGLATGQFSWHFPGS